MQKKTVFSFKMKRLFFKEVSTETVVSSEITYFFFAFSAFSAFSQSLSWSPGSPAATRAL